LTNVHGRTITTALPPAPAIFHGREEYVVQIVRFLVDGHLANQPARVPIMGAGGMGKTSVALAVLNHQDIIEIFGSRRHWIPCDQTSTLPNFLEHLAQSLSLEGPSKDRLKDIILHLQAHPAPFIFAIDNFETLWDLPEIKSAAEDVLSHLAGLRNLTLLLTSRGNMHPARVRWCQLPAIEQLSLAAARATFMDISTNIDDRLDDLLRALDCVALAITLVASLSQTGYSPSELLKDWENERTPLLHLGADRQSSVEVSIRLSIYSPPMKNNPDALALLTVLARLPGGIQQKYLSSIASGVENINAAQRTLISVALAHRTANNTLRVLSPVRSYLLQHHVLSTSSATAMRSFYFSLVKSALREIRLGEVKNAKQVLAEEETNIEIVIAGALVSDTGTDALLAALEYSSYLSWSARPRIDIMCTTIAAIRFHSLPNQLAYLPRCIYKLASLYHMQSDFANATIDFSEALGFFAPGGDWLGVAQCLESLGNIHREQGDSSVAAAHLTAAETSFMGLGCQLEAARCHESLANVYLMEKKFDAAITAIAEAKASFEAIGHRFGVANCLKSLAVIYNQIDRPTSAILTLRKAYSLFEAEDDQLGVAQCLKALGVVYHTHGDLNAALDAFAEAITTFEAVGNRVGVMQCLQGLGDIHREEGRFEEALRLFKRADELARRIGDFQSHAECLLGLAMVFRALDRFDDARIAYHDAILAYQRLGMDDEVRFCEAELEKLSY
jgi:tetratricopeptide (TPR) repeat protein